MKQRESWNWLVPLGDIVYTEHQPKKKKWYKENVRIQQFKLQHCIDEKDVKYKKYYNDSVWSNEGKASEPKRKKKNWKCIKTIIYTQSLYLKLGGYVYV